MRTSSISARIPGAILLALVLALPLALPVRAEDFAGDVPDRVWIDIGGQTNELRTQASVTGKAGVGTVLDFEDVFDLPGDKTTFRLLGTARISERRRWIDFGYTKIDRSGAHVLANDVDWGDYVIHSGATVGAKFNTEFVYVAFRYDFLHEEKVRISGSAGISYMNLGMGLATDGSVDGPNGPVVGHFSKDESIGVPVPLIGLNLDWAITRRLMLRTYNRLFRIKVGGNDGGQYDSGMHLNWYFVKYFGLGVGYDKTEVRINEINLSGDKKGKANYTVSGFGLYANIAF